MSKHFPLFSCLLSIIHCQGPHLLINELINKALALCYESHPVMLPSPIRDDCRRSTWEYSTMTSVPSSFGTLEYDNILSPAISTAFFPFFFCFPFPRQGGKHSPIPGERDPCPWHKARFACVMKSPDRPLWLCKDSAEPCVECVILLPDVSLVLYIFFWSQEEWKLVQVVNLKSIFWVS